MAYTGSMFAMPDVTSSAFSLMAPTKNTINDRATPVNRYMTTKMAKPVDGSFSRNENKYAKGMADKPNAKNRMNRPKILVAIIPIQFIYNQ